MRVPKLCRHKRSGLAYVTDPATKLQVYFGPWGTAEANAGYQRWLLEHVARCNDVASGAKPGTRLSLAQFCADYLAWAEKYYVKRGEPTSEVWLLKRSIREALTLFHGTQAADFGPTQLKAVRQKFIDIGWNLDSINKQVAKLIRVFRWGVENELIRPEQLVALRAVKSLSPGRCPVKVSKPILPVPVASILAAAKCAREPHATMLRVHLATGMRTCELIDMRADRIDTTRTPWVYVPKHNKSEHRGIERFIYIGPEARELLAPFLERAKKRRDLGIWISRRNKPMGAMAYWCEVRRAVKLAGVPRFRPLQIRHTAATIFRQAAGIEAAQALLGHERLNTSEIYAEKRVDLATDIIEKIG